MQAAEAAVAHDHHVRAGLSLTLDPLNDAFQRITDDRRHSAQRGSPGQIPAKVGRCVPDHLIGIVHTFRQTIPMRAELHRVGARLNDGDQRRVADALAQTVERGGNGGRVVSEIVIDGDAAHFRDFFHASFDAFERAQRGDAHGRHHTDVTRCSQSSQGVGDVVLASHVPLDNALGDAFEHDFEPGAVFAEQFDLPLATGSGGLHRGPAAHLDHALQGRFGGWMNDQAFARNGSHQMVELPLDGRQIRKDVGVVELKVIQDRRARTVVNEFRAFVEKGAVILIRFDHEKRRIAQACRYGEVLRHPADQETRAHARMLQHPGEHAAGGGFAMSTRDGEHPAILQHVVGQPLRPGDVRQAFVQHIFHRRVAAGHGIANDHEVRRRIQLRRIVTLGQFDALGFELSAHRRIDVGIGARHMMAEFLGQNRHRTHESAADTKNMNVHSRPRKTWPQVSVGRRNSHSLGLIVRQTGRCRVCAAFYKGYCD